MEVSGKRTDKTLSTSILHGSEDDIQLYCQPCDRDGPRVPAYGYCQDCGEHLCETCYKIHRKPAPLRSHILLDGSKMPKTQNVSSLPAPSDLTELCQQHGKLISYFCRDHNILGCSPCITLNHRTCKVDYIPDASRNYDASDEYRNLLQTLNTLHENCKRITSTTGSNKKKILQNQSTIKNEIKKFRQEMNRTLDKWEAEIDKQATDLLQDEKTKTESMGRECSKTSTEIKQVQDDLKSLASSNKNNQLFVKVKKTQGSLMNYTNAVSNLKETGYKGEVNFQPNHAIQHMLRSETCLGQLVFQNKKETTDTPKDLLTVQQGATGYSQKELSVTSLVEQKKSIPPSLSLYDSLTATESGQINVKVPSDKTAPRVRGIAVIGFDQLAVADGNNNTIKIVDTKQEKVVSNVTLSSMPWDVKLLPEDQLAVTLPQEREILVLSVTGGLSEVRQMKCEGICCGLAYTDGKLIVACQEAKVQIITLEGEVIRTIQSDQSGKKMFKLPRYAAVDEKRKTIYISDVEYGKGNITCLNLKGELMAVCEVSETLNSYGLTVLIDGSILYCSEELRLVSPDLSKSRILLQKGKIRNPNCLVIDSKQNKLYVCCSRNAVMQVYDLKWN